MHTHKLAAFSRASASSASALVIAASLLLGGCSRGADDSAAAGSAAAPTSDSAFAALQERGKLAMGVDQYTSTHVFEDLPDGGRIVLQRDSADAAGTEVIRAHLRDIAGLFAQGDFRIPGMVHAMEVAGTKVMAERKAMITYVADTLPRGGQVRIRTTDPQALKAVHEFLAFQRMDHRAAGHDH